MWPPPPLSRVMTRGRGGCPRSPQLLSCTVALGPTLPKQRRAAGLMENLLTGNLMEQKLIVAQDGVCSMKGPDFSVIPNIRPLRGRHHVIG